VRAGDDAFFAGADYLSRRQFCWQRLSVAESIKSVLSHNDLRADVDATIQIDHVVVDKAEAAG
jgi:hypothetical protein